MAVSNVNFSCTHFSNVREPATVEEFWVDFIKFMVSGGDPLGIEKIVITDGVARVTTVEKSFNSVPGVKLDIAGSGNAKVDGRIEISAVFDDGFSFSTEAVNATFTNGLTYAISPLGWSLISRTTTKIIIKSGPSAETTFYVILELKEGAWISSICYDYETGNYLENIWPSFAKSGSYVFFPMVSDFVHRGLGGQVNLNYNFKYWIYGDDAFFVINNGCYNSPYYPDSKSVMKLGLGSLAAYGEIGGPTVGKRFHLLHGYTSATLFPDVSNNFLTYYATGSLLSNVTGAFGDSYLGMRNSNGGSFSYAAKASLYDGGLSGSKLSNNNNFPSSVQRFRKIEILNRDYIYAGDVPGIWNIANNFSGNSEIAIIPYRVTSGSLAGKKCVIVPVNGANNSYYSTASAFNLLNLTGPIR